MDKKDEKVLIQFAYAKANPLNAREPEKNKKYMHEYAELVNQRYAVLITWWESQTKPEKDTWYDLMSSRFSIENSAQMREDLVTVLLEFSRAFAVDEREAVLFVARDTRTIRSAWAELRQEVWLRFCKAVHI